jgi:hypothetical protein
MHFIAINFYFINDLFNDAYFGGETYSETSVWEDNI